MFNFCNARSTDKSRLPEAVGEMEGAGGCSAQDTVWVQSRGIFFIPSGSLRVRASVVHKQRT